MTIPKEVKLKILGEIQLISLLSREIEKNPEYFRITSQGIEKDQSSLDFGLVEVAALVTIVQGVAYLSTFVSKLLSTLEQSKSKTIVVQTPISRAEIQYSDELTEQKIKDVLDNLIKLP